MTTRRYSDSQSPGRGPWWHSSSSGRGPGAQKLCVAVNRRAVVEEVMDDWDLIDGILVDRPDVGTMRVGHGTVDGEAAWWVEVPSGNTAWNYHAHLPRIFTGEWVYWLYSRWLA